MEMKASDYRRLSRKEKKAFKAAGGKLILSWVDKVGMTVTVIMIAGVAWMIDKTSAPVNYEKEAQATCLSEGINQIQELRPEYASVNSVKEGARYKITYNFKAPNGLGRYIPGRLYCETDLTGSTILLVNVARR